MMLRIGVERTLRRKDRVSHTVITLHRRLTDLGSHLVLLQTFVLLRLSRSTEEGVSILDGDMASLELLKVARHTRGVELAL